VKWILVPDLQLHALRRRLSVDFIERELVKRRPVNLSANLSLTQVCLNAYEFLITDLLAKTDARIKQKVQKGIDAYSARKQSEHFYAQTMAIAYGEHTIIQAFNEYANGADVPSGLKSALRNISDLYAAHHLWKHVSLLYMGGYCSGADFGRHIQEGILNTCAQLKPNAVALVDAIAPPDHILNSTLGASDGQAYKRLFASMLNAHGAVERPPFWSDFVTHMNEDKAKL